VQALIFERMLNIFDPHISAPDEKAVSRICQCCGSMPFWGGSGSADPFLLLMDPDPAIFVIDLQGASKKIISDPEQDPEPDPYL
jgi:hypothetical protein